MLIIVRGNIQYNIPNILGYIVPDIVGYMLNRTGQVSWTGRGSSEKKLIGNIVPIVYQILMETVPGPSELDWEQYFWKKLIGKILKNIFPISFCIFLDILLYRLSESVVEWIFWGNIVKNVGSVAPNFVRNIIGNIVLNIVGLLLRSSESDWEWVFWKKLIGNIVPNIAPTVLFPWRSWTHICNHSFSYLPKLFFYWE